MPGGFFFESWNAGSFSAAGLDLAFMQDNHSRSQKGVLRGMHFQNPGPQGKLVRVVRGAVFDVAVDLRASSPNLRQMDRGDAFRRKTGGCSGCRKVLHTGS